MIPWWYQAFIIVVDILAFSLVAVVAYRSGRLAERLEREAVAEKTHQDAGPGSI
jgi:hypothetical protein